MKKELPMLAVHGFVLAGGKSSRMGVDKATLRFCGKPMVAIAVEKLRSFCAEVSIAGNRDDLAEFAPVVREARTDAGPVAGIEAALLACTQPWALFVPVDAPLVPAEMLRAWAAGVLPLQGCGAAFLLANKQRQPAFCMVRADLAGAVTAQLDRGTRRIDDLLLGFDDNSGDNWIDIQAAEKFLPVAIDAEAVFLNVNAPEELTAAEAWAAELNIRG